MILDFPHFLVENLEYFKYRENLLEFTLPIFFHAISIKAYFEVENHKSEDSRNSPYIYKFC